MICQFLSIELQPKVFFLFCTGAERNLSVSIKMRDVKLQLALAWCCNIAFQQSFCGTLFTLSFLLATYFRFPITFSPITTFTATFCIFALYIVCPFWPPPLYRRCKLNVWLALHPCFQNQLFFLRFESFKVRTAFQIGKQILLFLRNSHLRLDGEGSCARISMLHIFLYLDP